MVIALPAGLAGEALVGVLLLAAALAIALLVADMLSALPVIGPTVGGAARNAMLGAIGHTVVWAQQSAQQFASVIFGPFYALWTVIDAMTWTDYKLAQKIWGLASISIPRVVSWAQSAIYASELRSYTYTNYVKLALWEAIGAWVNILRSEAAADFQWLRAYTDYVKLALWTVINGWVAILVQRMDAGDALSRQYTEAVGGQVARYAESAASTALSAALSELARERLRAQGAEGAITGYVGSVAGVLARDIVGAEVRANAYAGALAVPIAAAVTAIEESPCIKACDPLGDLGSFLQELTDLGVIAALLLLAQQAARDPHGAATEVLDVVRPIVDDAGAAMRDLVGV